MRQVVEVSSGVAVAADDTWTALKGRDALQITWDEGRNARPAAPPRCASLTRTNVKPAEADQLQAVCTPSRYQAHVPLEPMTCVADVRADSAEVWAPTQDRASALNAARISGLPADRITVHVPLIGGAFGRRLQIDYVTEAVSISKEIGLPVKLFWTREDDMQNDYYHPPSVSVRQEAIGLVGQTKRADHRRWAACNRCVALGREFYRCLSYRVVRLVDEFAAATGQDPLDLRLALHAGTPSLPCP